MQDSEPEVTVEAIRKVVREEVALAIRPVVEAQAAHESKDDDRNAQQTQAIAGLRDTFVGELRAQMDGASKERATNAAAEAETRANLFALVSARDRTGARATATTEGRWFRAIVGPLVAAILGIATTLASGWVYFHWGYTP